MTSHSTGKRGEGLATLFLRAKGYAIVARNWRAVTGEIDIIARRGEWLCFIEVKTRGHIEDARDAISAHQRRRIEHTAQAFVQSRPDLADLDMRFDAIFVSGARTHHLQNAWWMGE